MDPDFKVFITGAICVISIISATIFSWSIVSTEYNIYSCKRYRANSIYRDSCLTDEQKLTFIKEQKTNE